MRILWILVFTGLAAFGQVSTPWKVLSKLAEQRGDADDIAGSAALSEEALRCGEQQLGPDHPQIVSLSTQLGGVLHRQRRDREAEPVLRRALEIAKQSADEKLIAIALNALGSALWGEGQPERAEPVMRRSLALFRESAGADAIETGKAANNLASLYSDTGQYEHAEMAMTEALAVYEKHRSSFPSLFAMGLRNMFVILFQQRRFAEGEPYLIRALEIGESAFPNSLKMAELRFAKAALEVRRGRFPEAAGLLKQVIEVQERFLGSQHPDLAQSLLTYSAVLRKMHQRSDADEVQKRGASILKSLR